jgi:hypothetical protein
MGKRHTRQLALGASGSTTIRSLVLRAKDRDDEAFQALVALIRPDLSRVVSKNLSDKRLYDDILQAVIVRLFVYLPRFQQRYVHRSTATDPAGDQRCLNDLRRWSTNLARNWTRTVNQYGTSQAERWLIPSWATGKQRPRRATIPRGIVSSLDHLSDSYDDEQSSVAVADNVIHRALVAGRRVL